MATKKKVAKKRTAKKAPKKAAELSSYQQAQLRMKESHQYERDKQERLGGK